VELSRSSSYLHRGLLGRSYGAVRNRVTKLLCEPYAYLRLPEQPRNNYRNAFFQLHQAALPNP